MSVEVIAKYQLEESSGDLLRLDSKMYVTHAALIKIARREGCLAIRVSLLNGYCSASKNTWYVKAVVVTRRGSRFEGLGDAGPGNVPLAMAGAAIRIAETRAVNRALRKAYGIGLCSAEELETEKNTSQATSAVRKRGKRKPVNSVTAPLLRDQLSLLIRHYKLDPDLVKAYAADFCGTEVLREASRELVQDFVHALRHEAEHDLPALRCRLESYAKSEGAAA